MQQYSILQFHYKTNSIRVSQENQNLCTSALAWLAAAPCVIIMSYQCSVLFIYVVVVLWLVLSFLGVYDEMILGKYSMKSEPRGRCLVINMNSFEKGTERLDPRQGAQEDVSEYMSTLAWCKTSIRLLQSLLPDDCTTISSTGSSDYRDWNMRPLHHLLIYYFISTCH